MDLIFTLGEKSNIDFEMHIFTIYDKSYRLQWISIFNIYTMIIIQTFLIFKALMLITANHFYLKC